MRAPPPPKKTDFFIPDYAITEKIQSLWCFSSPWHWLTRSRRQSIYKIDFTEIHILTDCVLLVVESVKEDKAGDGDQSNDAGNRTSGGALQPNGTPPLSADHIHTSTHAASLTTFVTTTAPPSGHVMGYAPTSYGHIASPMTSSVTTNSANNTPVGK